MFCPKCGSPCTEGAKFCVNCGTALLGDKAANQGKKKSPLRIIIPTVLCTIAVVCAIWASVEVNQKNKDDNSQGSGTDMTPVVTAVPDWIEANRGLGAADPKEILECVATTLYVNNPAARPEWLQKLEKYVDAGGASDQSPIDIERVVTSALIESLEGDLIAEEKALATVGSEFETGLAEYKHEFRLEFASDNYSSYCLYFFYKLDGEEKEFLFGQRLFLHKNQTPDGIRWFLGVGVAK